MKDFVMPFDQTVIGDRYESFKLALEKFIKGDGQYIVETGCIRWDGDMQSGGSTLIFALVAKEYGIRFDSIDFEERSIQAAMRTVRDVVEYVNFIEADSVTTLKNWDKPIDLLYLDSLGCSAEPEKAQLHQLAEIEAAYDKLTDKSVVLLDDNINEGKTKLSKKFLLDKGWTILIDKTQCLLAKENL